MSKYPVCTKASRARRMAVAVAGCAVVLAGCASPEAQMQQRWADEADEIRTQSLTPAAYARAAADIETWAVGDRVQRTACKTTTIPSMRRNVPDSIEYTCDGWVGPLSGRSPFSCGTVVGRLRTDDGDELFLGQQLFGYLQKESVLIPRYAITLQAQTIDESEYETLKAQGEFVGRNPTYWKDCTIREIRKLDIPELDFTDAVAEERIVEPHEAMAVSAEITHEWTTKERFERAREALETVPIGADRWDVIHALDAYFHTLNRGRDYALMMNGFLYMHGNEFYTVEVTDDAVFKVWPFGYTEQSRQIPKLDLIMKNEKVVKLIPHVAQEELASYFE
jgi:hypothetical protein